MVGRLRFRGSGVFGLWIAFFLPEARRQSPKRQSKSGLSRKQPTVSHKAYEKAKAYADRTKRNINSYVGPDVDTVKLIMAVGDEFIREYESGDETARVTASKAYMERLKLVYGNKPVYGYKYNSLLKKEIAVPIVFGIYRNSDDFYIEVGDGAFCTVASLPIDAL